MLSPSDTAIVFVLALLLFGPEQLPKIARQLGDAMRHVQNTTHTFMQEMERAAEPSDIPAPILPLDEELPTERADRDETRPAAPVQAENELGSGHPNETAP